MVHAASLLAHTLQPSYGAATNVMNFDLSILPVEKQMAPQPRKYNS